MLDLVEDLRIDGALARERVDRLTGQDGTADAAIAQIMATYESLKNQVDDVAGRLDEWTAAAGTGTTVRRAVPEWFRKVSSLINTLLRRLASMLAGMANPKEWVLKGEISGFLTKGQIEIKFGR